jgi:hypothetical protein
MNMTADRVRLLGVALLLGALLNHGISHVTNLDVRQPTPGLLRLARDLTRRTGGSPTEVIDQCLDLIDKPERVRQLPVLVERGFTFPVGVYVEQTLIANCAEGIDA